MIDGYPHSPPLQTRWKDNDVYGHVNNVEYYAYFDTVINAWLIAEGGLDIHARRGRSALCAESHCEFTAAVAFPDAVEAASAGGQARPLERPLRDRPLPRGRGGAAADRLVRARVRGPRGAAAGAIPEPLRAALERLVPAAAT